MSTTPETIRDWIERAKNQLGSGTTHQAQAAATIAIAELLALKLESDRLGWFEAGAKTTAEAIGTVLGTVLTGGSTDGQATA